MVPLAEIVAWADDLIGVTDTPEMWMIDLSLARDEEDAVHVLDRVSLSAAGLVGLAMFLARIYELWSRGEISRGVVCYLILYESNRLPSEATVPSALLEDAEACLDQGGDDPGTFARVDEALRLFLGRYAAFSQFIPGQN